MIPKIIYIYWNNKEYPKLIEYNINKIKQLHPDYIINILDKRSIKSYIEIDKHEFNFNDKILNTHTYFSDIIRFFLLEKYGGIWIDAGLIFWKRVDNIIKSNNSLYLIRNYNNDNGYNNKGYESWFIASVPNHPFIKQIKRKIIALNTYDKIRYFIDNRKFNIQKNVRLEYHLVYHIISYVQQKYPNTLADYAEFDSKLLYPNNYIPNIANFPFTNANTSVINFSTLFNYLAAKKIESYIRDGEPKHIIASKITSGVRKHINYF